jgi:hypothetical protein
MLARGSHMSAAVLLTTIVTVLLAILGYIATYWNNIRIGQRQERLKWLNRQIQELYGPLLALTMAGDETWRRFRTVYRKDVPSYFSDDPPPTESDIEMWRHWMKTVFTPINRRAYELVVTRADLLIETTMPPCLLQLCAYVAGFEAVLAKWEIGDYSMHLGVVPHPREALNQYAQRSFESLKEEQAQLLGRRLRLTAAAKN